MDRMQWIKARQIARLEGYSVHVLCSSEAKLDRNAPIWRCCQCGVVPSEEVADRLSATESAADDVGYLLTLLEEKGNV